MKPIQLTVRLPFSYWQQHDEETGAPLHKPEERVLAAYLQALLREIRSLGADLEDIVVDSVHFAGGYMSLLSPDEFGEAMACIRRSFPTAPDMQVSGVLFPGSLNMALISANKNYRVGPLMLEVPSLIARECDRLHLPNAMQALDKTVYLMQNFGVNDFGLRLPIGFEGRDEGMWQFILGQIHHYQPLHIAFADVSGGTVAEPPAFDAVAQRLVEEGFTRLTQNFFTAMKAPPRFALSAQREEAGVGLGAVSRLDGYITRSTTDIKRYIAYSADYRQLIVSAEELHKG